MRAAYSNYVSHIARYYFNNPNVKEFRSECDKLNYSSVEKVFRYLPVEEKRFLTIIYTSEDVSKTINRLAREYRIKERKLWRILTQFEKNVATVRGLR